MRQCSNTKQELIDNTVKSFNSLNRSVRKKDEVCMYRGKRGRACAIGREISDELAKEFDQMLDSQFGAASVSLPDIFNKLPNRLQKMGVDFLKDIQFLHDTKSNWNLLGLSKSGKKKVINICMKYGLKNPC